MHRPFINSDELQWDELIFTQEWGFAACRQFKDRLGPGSEKRCRFEGKPSIWSVHGIWYELEKLMNAYLNLEMRTA